MPKILSLYTQVLLGKAFRVMETRAGHMEGYLPENFWVYFEKAQRDLKSIEHFLGLIKEDEEKELILLLAEFLKSFGELIPDARDYQPKNEAITVDEAIKRGKALIGQIKYGITGENKDKNKVVQGTSTEMDCIGLVSYMFETPDTRIASNDKNISYSFAHSKYFKQNYVTPDGWTNDKFDLEKNDEFKKETNKKLRVGDLIVWDYSSQKELYGHVAVVINLDPLTVIESAVFGPHNIGGVRLRKLLDEPGHKGYLTWFREKTKIKSIGYYSRNYNNE